MIKQAERFSLWKRKGMKDARVRMTEKEKRKKGKTRAAPSPRVLGVSVYGVF